MATICALIFMLVGIPMIASATTLPRDSKMGSEHIITQKRSGDVVNREVTLLQILNGKNGLLRNTFMLEVGEYVI